jgi:Domain of unknown function (DUF4386)
MDTETISGNAGDPEGRWIYLTGGICAFLLGLGYVMTIPLYTYAGSPPNGGEAWLRYGEGKTTIWWIILGLMVFTDILYIPISVALYSALQKINRKVMTIAIAFVGLFVALDLTVTWTNYAALITLSGNYAAATSDAQRAATVAAATYASSVMSSKLEIVYSIVDLSFGILLISMVMLKSIFPKGIAWVGIVAAIFGLVAIVGWNVAVMMNALLATIWILLVGFRLFQIPKKERAS